MCALKLRLVGRNIRAADFRPIALMLYRQIKRPMIAHVGGHLEARRLQSLLASGGTYVFHSLVAGQSIDVGGNLILLSPRADTFSRSLPNFVKHPGGFPQRR